MKQKSFYEQCLEVDNQLSKTIDGLNAAIRAIKTMREEFSEQLLMSLKEPKWEFPENNYSVLAT